MPQQMGSTHGLVDSQAICDKGSSELSCVSHEAQTSNEHSFEEKFCEPSDLSITPNLGQSCTSQGVQTNEEHTIAEILCEPCKQGQEAEADDDAASLVDFYDLRGEEKVIDFLEELVKPFGKFEFRCDYLPGGAYNSVVKVDAYDSKSPRKELIIRLSKELTNATQFYHSIALLNFLSNKFPFVAQVVAADDTTANALGKQYSLQTRMPGKCLIDEFVNLNLQQRLFLADEVASCLAQIAALKMKTCGGLVLRGSKMIVGCPQFSREFNKIGIWECSCFSKGERPRDLREYIEQRFKALAKSSGMFHTFAYWWKIVEIHLPAPNKKKKLNRLTHTDFEKRNILIEERDGMPHISAVVDWDDCEVLPPELAYTIPGWLWGLDEEKKKEERDPLGYDPDIVPINQEHALVRERFMNAINNRLPKFIPTIRQMRAKPELIVFGRIARQGDRCSSAMLDLAMDSLTKHNLIEAFREEASTNTFDRLTVYNGLLEEYQQHQGERGQAEQKLRRAVQAGLRAKFQQLLKPKS